MNGNLGKVNNQLNKKAFNINAFISKHNAVKSYFNTIATNEERNKIKQLVSMMGILEEEELIKMAKLLPFFTVLASITVQNAAEASGSSELSTVQGAMAESLGAAAELGAAVAAGEDIAKATNAFARSTASLNGAVELAEGNAGLVNPLVQGAIVNAEIAGNKALATVNSFEGNPTEVNAGKVVVATEKAANAAKNLAKVSGNQQAANNAAKAAKAAENARLAAANGNPAQLVTSANATANAVLNTAAVEGNGMQGGAPKKAPKKKAAPKKKPSKK